MKQKISISIEEDIVKQIEAMLNDKSGSFRNKSHLIEFALNKLMQEKK